MHAFQIILVRLHAGFSTGLGNTNANAESTARKLAYTIMYGIYTLLA